MQNETESSEHGHVSASQSVPAEEELWLREKSREELLKEGADLLIPQADDMTSGELIHAIFSARRSRSTLDSHDSRR